MNYEDGIFDGELTLLSDGSIAYVVFDCLKKNDEWLDGRTIRSKIHYIKDMKKKCLFEDNGFVLMVMQWFPVNDDVAMMNIKINSESSIYHSEGLVFVPFLSHIPIVYTWRNYYNYEFYVKRSFLRSKEKKENKAKFDLMCSPGNRWNGNHIVYHVSGDSRLEDKIGSICEFHYNGKDYVFVKVRKDKRDPDSKFNCNEMMFNVVEPLTFEILFKSLGIVCWRQKEYDYDYRKVS